MTVRDLKEMLEEADDDMVILVPVSDVFDGAFYTPCCAESGVGEMSMHQSEEDATEARLLNKPATQRTFLVVPCGFFNRELHAGMNMN